MAKGETALVLFSGGQDSTICLADALSRFARVETVGFDYGQTHRVELDCRDRLRDEIQSRFPDWGARLGDDHMLPLPALEHIGGTALIGGADDMNAKQKGLPITFVPGRNLLFLTYAAALAWRRNIGVLVGGMCETDYSGYPDCRRATLDALEESISLGIDAPIRIDTPLMYIDKAESWRLAAGLGGDALTDMIIEHTHSCYRGERSQRFDWGYGCNDCPACDLRAAGYAAWVAAP